MSDYREIGIVVQSLKYPNHYYNIMVMIIIGKGFDIQVRILTSIFFYDGPHAT